MVEAPPMLRLLPKLFKARSYVPDIKVPDFRHVDFHALRRAGYRGVVVDKDNCLTRPYEDGLVPHLRPAWEECKAAFGPGRVLIVSNSSGTKSDPTGLGAEALHRETGVPVLIHPHKKPLCARDIDAYFEALPPGLPLPPLSAAQEASVAAAPGAGVAARALKAVGGLMGAEEKDETSAATSTSPAQRNLGLVVIGDRLLTDVLLTSLLAVPKPAPTTAGLKFSPLSIPTSPAAVLSTDHASLPPAKPSKAGSPPSAAPRAPPYNLSLLLTTLPQPADVRPLRLIERMLETLSRRRLSRSVAADIAHWRSIGIVRPEPAPPAPLPLEGWRKGLSLAGQATGWTLGELVRGLTIAGGWAWARARQAWAERQARRDAEQEVKEKGEVALERLVKEDVEEAHAFHLRAVAAEGTPARETAPVMPQREAEVAAVKA